MFSFLTGGSASNTVRSIDRLLSRVQHSTVIDEKIDALQQLAELPLPDLTESRVAEVLTKALVDIIENDHQRDDEDVCSEIMKTLVALTSDLIQKTEGTTSDEQVDTVDIKEYATRNVEMMLDCDRLFTNFHQCLTEPRALPVRLFALRLILNSLKFQRTRVQEFVLCHSGFVKSIVELLINTPEILRNDAILLLEALAEDNPTIQKIAVFDGLFEILLEIATDEGGSGVVACDCYRLIALLLQGTDSNVKYFGEIGCIQRIPKILLLNLQALKSGNGSHDVTKTENQDSEQSVESSSTREIVHSFELSLSVISQVCRIPGIFQSQFFSQGMADALYQVIDHDMVSLEMKCSLLRVVGRSLIGCKSSCSVFSDLTINSCSLSVYHLRLAMNGADVIICSNALFVLESFFYQNHPAQISAVSTLAPAPDSDSDRTGLFGTELVQSLSRWQNDIKCLGDCLLFWTTCRILIIITRRNDVAKQIALTTALSVPIDDRPAPRLFDSIIRTIQVAFDSSHADARVRISLLLLLCELLVSSQEAVHSLLQASHLTETLLAGQSWKSMDPIVSGLSCLLWAFCLDVADPEIYNSLLHRIIMVQIGVDNFKSRLSMLQSAAEFQKPRLEMSYEPMLLTKLQLFDSYFVEQANRVIDLCDSRILTLVVIFRDDAAPSEPKMIPSSLISDELIAARSKIAELESDLASALKALADKTDEAALTRYRLDLAQKELNCLTEGKHHASFEELQQNYEQLQSEHEELKSHYGDLMVLLASLESEREVKPVAQKIDERIERSQNDEAFTEGIDTIKILIGTTTGLPLRLESNDSCQVYYRISGRKWRLNGHDWILAESNSGTRAYLRHIIPNQQYQVSVIYTTQAQMQFKQLFHFCSPQIFTQETKVKIFNNMPSNHNLTSATSDQDLLLVDCIAAVLLKEATSIIEQIITPDVFHIQRAIAKWGIALLERVVQNSELAAKKSLAVRAIVYSMLVALEYHQPVNEGATDVEKPAFKIRLQSIYGRTFKNEHKRSGKASHILRVVKHIARELFQVDDAWVCDNDEADFQTYSEQDDILTPFRAPKAVEYSMKDRELNNPTSVIANANEARQSHP